MLIFPIAFVWISLLFLVTVEAGPVALIYPASSTSAAELDGGYGNSTSDGTLGNGMFEVKPRDWGTQIRSEACLINSVYFVGQIALDDWSGLIPRPKLYRYPEYPDVFFAIIPRPDIPFKNEYAIRGIAKAIYYMNFYNKWRTVVFNLEMDDVLVGFLYIRHQALPPQPSILSILPGEVQTPSPQLDSVMAANTTLNITNDQSNNSSLTAVSLKVKMTAGESPMPRYVVIWTLIIGLTDAAMQGPDERVLFDRPVKGGEVDAMTEFKPKSRQQAPFLQFKHVIEALVVVPKFMVKNEYWGELEMTLSFGGFVIGTGYIKRWPPSLSGLTGGNLSIS